jgi:hypothetical protein
MNTFDRGNRNGNSEFIGEGLYRHPLQSVKNASLKPPLPGYSPGFKVFNNEKVINIAPKQLISNEPVQIRIKTVKK